MTIDTNDILNSILESLSRIDYIHPEDIPNIDLYMDQVTTFMDTQLSSTKRYADDKILTKTMINNYAKNNLLPPPVKKKYSKDHLLLLIFIYYFKSILSIKDIETLLKPMTDAGFGQALQICTSRSAPCAKASLNRSKKIFLLPGRLPERHFPRFLIPAKILFRFWHLSAA